MNKEEGFFPSFDGTEIFYRAWTQPSTHSMLLIHGYGNHCGNFSELVDKLSHLPISFYAFDLRGQGRSKGRPVHAENFQDYVRDAYTFLDYLAQKGKIGKGPIFLLGHSLGGLISVRIVETNEKRWKALILSSPCFEIYGIAWLPITRFLTKILAKIAPKLIMSNLVRPHYLFHDEERMKIYLKDKLIVRKITCHLANVIVLECLKSQRQTFKINIPILLLMSGDDRIVSVSRTKKWFEALDSGRKTVKIYPTLYHEIFNETHAPQPVQDLISFLNEHLKE